MTLVAARPLPYYFPRGIYALDSTGETLRVVLNYTGDSIIISTIKFGIPDAQPIQGNPDELMKEWQFKLGLELNSKTGEITERKY